MRIRTSFWFIPTLMGLCGLALAALAPFIDEEAQRFLSPG